MTDIKTVLTDEQIAQIGVAQHGPMTASDVGVVLRLARAIEAAVLAASAPAQEPVCWEYRHLDTCNEPHTWGKWERVEESRGTLADLQHYIASGYKYELRALYAAPVNTQDAVDAKRLDFVMKNGLPMQAPSTHWADGMYRYHGVDIWQRTQIEAIDAAMQASQSPQDQEQK